MAGLRFLLTGIFESLEREEAEELIKKYGGTTLHAVTKKLDYLVVGSEPGPAKITKAIYNFYFDNLTIFNIFLIVL